MSKEYFVSNVEVSILTNDVAACLVSSDLFNDKAFSRFQTSLVLSDSVIELLHVSIERFFNQDSFVEKYSFDYELLNDFFFSLSPFYTKSGKTEIVEIKKGVSFLCLKEL